MINYEKLGYNFGIIHYQFAKYINDNYKDKKILCNSRDAYITNILLKEIFNNNNVNYLYTSRKVLLNTAWNIDSPIDSEVNKFIYESIIFGRYKNVYELLNFLDLTDYIHIKSYYFTKKIMEKVHEAGFKGLYDNIMPFQRNHAELLSKIKKLVISLQKIIYGKRYEHTLKARNILKELVKNDNVFVDVGWNGTTQYYLENLLNIELNGVYFETFQDVIKLPRDIKTDKFMKNFNNTCRGMQGLLEGCYFIAPHGSVDTYTENKHVLFKNIKKSDKKVRQEIIKGVLEFCKEPHTKINIELLESFTKRLLLNPTLEEVELINKIMHSNNGYESSIVNYKGKFNEQDYNRSFWKIGYNLLNENKCK